MFVYYRKLDTLNSVALPELHTEALHMCRDDTAKYHRSPKCQYFLSKSWSLRMTMIAHFGSEVELLLSSRMHNENGQEYWAM